VSIEKTTARKSEEICRSILRNCRIVKISPPSVRVVLKCIVDTTTTNFGTLLLYSSYFHFGITSKFVNNARVRSIFAIRSRDGFCRSFSIIFDAKKYSVISSDVRIGFVAQTLSFTTTDHFPFGPRYRSFPSVYTYTHQIPLLEWTVSRAFRAWDVQKHSR